MSLGESKDILNKQKIFFPFTIDKRFWNKDMPNIFLNKVYEAQIGPEENGIQYTTLRTPYTYAKDERFQVFCSRLIGALGEALNQYHGLNESNSFWRAMLWLWVQEYATSMKFKIEQFKNLRKTYPLERYTYCSYAKKFENPYQFLSRHDVRYVWYDEEYHFATYSWIAEKFFDFRIEKKGVQNEKIAPQKVTLSIYGGLRAAFYSVVKIVISILNVICPSRARVGIFHAECGWRQVIKWYLRSRGAIQEISIPIEQEDYEIDDLFRKSLPRILGDKINAREEEQIVLDFLPYAVPPFFIEKFKRQYNTASDYLRKHKNLVVIFTLTSMLVTNAEKICELLLQERGGKVIGQQHGGTYQVTTSEQEHMRELEWNDVFYYWGKSALSYRIEGFPASKICYGPSYKFSHGMLQTFLKHFRSPSVNFGKFLFVGTVVEAYPRHYTYGDVDGEKEEYIQRKLRFFSALNNRSREKLLVREYPADYGWHMIEGIKSEFPTLTVSTRETFKEVLDECSLYISDYLATTWLESIYAEKPTVLLLIDHDFSIQNYMFRKEEKQYIDMLAEVGIIINSPEEAAKLVNYLAEYGVMEWWMDKERQRVVRLVRERWTTKVDGIDDWWYRELMSQVGKVEHGV